MPLLDGEELEEKLVRFRTLGCYPVTGAVESTSTDMNSLLSEMELTRQSERSGRLVDGDREESMEAKKRAGYF
jgi:sulfate adenylyltransferase subunit 2